MSILYSAEGGFELPQRTFDALVKIAHYYNYNASATLAAAASGPWKTAATREGGVGRGGGGGGGLEDDPSFQESPTTSLVGGRPMQRVGGNTTLVGENGANDDGVPVVPDRGNAPTDSSATDAFSPSAADNERAQHRPSSPGRARESAEPAAAAAAAAESVAAANTRTEVLGDLRQQQQQQQPVGDDWYTEGGGRPSGSSSKQQVGEGGGEDAWSRTAREITRLWVRAVGSLCCPSHSEHWPHLIDVGILGALNT